MPRHMTSKAKNFPQETSNEGDHHKLDKLDVSMIGLLCSGYSNQQISSQTRTPLSTIQRRARHLIEKEYVTVKHEPNYKKLGFKQGLLHIYLNDGDSKAVATELVKLTQIIDVSAHIGNSDLVASYVCKDSSQLLELMTAIKRLESVSRIVWSEQIYELKAGKNAARIIGYGE